MPVGIDSVDTKGYEVVHVARHFFDVPNQEEHFEEIAVEGFEAGVLPGGSVLIPLGIPDAEASQRHVGQFKELRTSDGLLLRVGSVEADIDEVRRLSRSRLRYERVHEDGTVESLERDWYRSWWTRTMFREMLTDAGFSKVSVLSQDGGRAAPDASGFVFLARKA